VELAGTGGTTSPSPERKRSSSTDRAADRSHPAEPESLRWQAQKLWSLPLNNGNKSLACPRTGPM
jgi:hypothetical protein